MADATETMRGGDPRRRALILSFGFPAAAWFFGSKVGLGAAVIAVGVWWTTPRPGRLLWPAAVGLLCLAPFAIWVQGLPHTSVVGADFGVRHWIANDLVISALVIASFVSLTELLRSESGRRGREGLVVRALRRYGQRLAPLDATPEASPGSDVTVDAPAEPAAPPAP